MSDPVLLTDVADRVALVTLNRPTVRNALSAELRRTLWSTMADLDGRDDVDAIVLTGADPAFCAGLDLRELAERPEFLGSAAGASSGGSGPVPELTKPLIGAVNGVAVTGGFEVALACDFLIASEQARFADTHARMGIMPGWGLTVRLPALIGIGRAKEMSLTGNYIDAQQALAWGLVNRVVAHHDLVPTCLALAADIVSNDQAGVRRMKRTYDQGTLITGTAAWELEAQVSADWTAKGVSGDDLAARRDAVIARGREQQN